MEPGYNLGAIWLQVIPSFDRVQDRAREEAKKAKAEWNKVWNEDDPAADRRARDAAKKRGEERAKAEAEGRSKAETAAEKRAELAKQKHNQALEASEKRHQQKLAETEAKGAQDRATIQEKYLTDRIAAEDDYFQKRQEAEDKFFRETEKLEADHEQRRKTNAAKSAADRERDERKHRQELEELREKHSNNLEILDRKREDDEIKRREALSDYIKRLDEKAQRDIAKERRAATERDHREALASEKRHAIQMEKLRDTLVKRGITDPQGFKRKMDQQLDKALENVDAELDLDLDTTEAQARLIDFQRRLAALRDTDVDVDVDAVDAVAEFMALIALAEQLERDDIDIDVDIDTSKALAELTALQATTSAVDRQGRQLGTSYDHAGGAAGSAANAFRAMNGVLLAAVTIGPLVVPVLMSLAGALGAVAAASLGAFAALGVGSLAMSGVGDALGAMTDLEDEQRYGQTPATQRRSARQSRSRDRAVRDARRGVASAQAAAANGVSAAVDRQARAEKALERAQVSARRAQEQLTRARREARREIEDMNDALISGTLSEQDALYDLEEARYSLFRIMQDGSATQREKDRAQLAYDIQAQQYAELQKQNDRLLTDTNEANRAGVEGSRQVVGAKEQIAQANESVVDAERDLADAVAGVGEAQREGAEQVALAQERLQDALLDQREAALDAAEGVGALDTAQRNLRKAMDDLGPAGQAFVLFLFGLKPLLDDLRYAAQEGFLPGLQAGLEMVVETYGPRLLDFVERFSTAMGGYAEQMGEWLIQPEVVAFFDTLGEFTLIFMDQFAQIAPALAEGLMGVMLALLPFAEDFGVWIIQLAEAFALWANSEEGQAALGTFFDYLRNITPEVAQMLAAAIVAIGHILIALAPYTEDLLDFAAGFFGWIASLDRDTLAGAVLGFIGLTVAFQALAGAMALILTTQGLIANIRWLGGGFGSLLAMLGIGKGGRAMTAAAGAGTLPKGKMAARALMRFGAIGLGIGLVLLGLYELYEHVEPFREFVDGIGAAATDLWETYLYPAFRGIYDWIVENLGPVFTWLYESVVKPNWDYIVLAISVAWTLIEIVFKLVWGGIKALGMFFTWLYEDVISPVWNAIYDNVLRPVYENAIKPMIDDFVGVMENLGISFESIVDGIGSVWNGLRQLLAMPIVFLIDTVLNDGLIAGVNAALDFFDIDPVGRVEVPQGIRNAAEGRFAAGGVLPGYTPGRDVHEFYSPTAGRLHLSGGEAIMRPEIVDVLGADMIYALNAAAVRGGAGGVRAALGGEQRSFAAGGVLGWLGDKASAAWNWTTSAASAAWDWIEDVASFAWDMATDPAAVLKRGVDKLLEGFSDWSEGSIPGRIITQLPGGIIDMMADGVKSMLGQGDAMKYMSAPVPKTGAGGRIYGAQPHVDSAANLLSSWVGGVDLMQAFNQSMAGDHPQGLAVDFIDDIGTLNRLAGFAERYADMLGLRYMAWQGRLFSPGAGWRPQTNGYGNDPWHRWHAHISFNPQRAYADGGIVPDGVTSDGNEWWRPSLDAPMRLYDNGGMWRSGEYGLNLSGQPEAVFTGEELDVFKQIAAGRGGRGDTILDIDVNNPGATAGEIADEMLWTMRQMERGGAYVG